MNPDSEELYALLSEVKQSGCSKETTSPIFFFLTTHFCYHMYGLWPWMTNLLFIFILFMLTIFLEKLILDSIHIFHFKAVHYSVVLGFL